MQSVRQSGNNPVQSPGIVSDGDTLAEGASPSRRMESRYQSSCSEPSGSSSGLFRHGENPRSYPSNAIIDEQGLRQAVGDPMVYELAKLREEINVLYQRVNTNYLTMLEVTKRLNRMSLTGITSLTKRNGDEAVGGSSGAVGGSGGDEEVGREMLDKVVTVISNELLQLQSTAEAHRMQSVKDKEILEKRIFDLGILATSNRRQMRTDGKIKWRIPNVLSVFQLQRSTTDVDKMSITSEHFQTPSGHEFRLRLFMNGSGRGKNTCMSLFIQMCRTEYDDTLAYPYMGVVTLRMYDQGQGRAKKHWEQRFRTNTSACFQKPEGQFCPENGLAQFITHDMLFKNSNGNADDNTLPIFVKNDVMFVGVDIIATEPVSA